MEEPRAIVIGPAEIPAGYESVVPGNLVDQLEGLGRALITSPDWPDSVDILVSSSPGPVLVMLGAFDDAYFARLATLRNELTTTPVRYIDYDQAEILTERLASKLRAALPDLEEWKFAAIPRGGLIVLGFLSYFLNLRRDQIVAPGTAAEALLIVDDCALSGTRLRQTLPSTGKIAIATLFSVPELRRTFLRKEAAVCEFVSAADLEDTAPERYGTDYSEWLQRWSDRTDDYWVGRTDHLIFPWAEPDVAVWNEAVGRVDAAWRLAPPDRSLKNRAETRPSRTVHRFERSTGQVKQAPDVLDLRSGDKVTIVDLARQRTLSLSGTAADMWSALLTTDDLDSAAQQVESLYQADPDRIEGDLADLSSFLTEEGLIVFDDLDETPRSQRSDEFS